MNNEEIEKPSTHKQVNITEVSNGYIVEMGHSCQPDKDGQERATVHATLDDMLEHLRNTFTIESK